MKGHRVRYVLAIKLVNELVEAADEKMLAKTIEPVMRNVVAWRWTRDQPGYVGMRRETRHGCPGASDVIGRQVAASRRRGRAVLGSGLG
jgi:hypothetical protein